MFWTKDAYWKEFLSFRSTTVKLKPYIQKRYLKSFRKAMFEPYARTRSFYRSMGFEPLITLTEMWDKNNPCLIMIKTLVKNTLN